VINALLGSYYAAKLAGATFDPGWSARVVDYVLTGLRHV